MEDMPVSWRCTRAEWTTVHFEQLRWSFTGFEERVSTSRGPHLRDFLKNARGNGKFLSHCHRSKSAPRQDRRTGTSYRIYPIDRNLELQLLYNSIVQAEEMKNVRICIRVLDHQKITAQPHYPLSNIDGGHWETCYPVGSRVTLFNVVDWSPATITLQVSSQLE